MNYILDNDGYIFDVSFGALIECDLGTCTEYSGDVPTGYDDLNDWAENACINAYKIVSGNLVLDATKQAELETLWEIQDEENTNATHKWVRGQLGGKNSVVLDEFSSNVTDVQVAELIDSGDYSIPKMSFEIPNNPTPITMIQDIDTGKYYLDGVSTQNGTPTPDTPIEIVNTYKAGTYKTTIDNKVYVFTLEDDLRSTPSSADRLWLDTTNLTSEVIKNVEPITLDGSETTWSKYRTLTNNTIFQTAISTAHPTSNDDKVYLSNYFNCISRNEFVANNDQTGISPNGYTGATYLILGIPNNICTELADFKTWLGTHNTIVYYELATPTSTSGVVNVYDSEVEIVVSNKNILGNKAVTTTIDGVTFDINSDKSITLNGTSTAAIEFILDGTLTSTEMLFPIKSNTDFIKSGLTENVSLNLYNYDGTDRTLLSSGGNEVINLTTGGIVTCSCLSIASGITFDEVTISPQLELGAVATDYIMHIENSMLGTLEDNSLTIEDGLNSFDPLSVLMVNSEFLLDIKYYTGKSTQTFETKIEALDESIETSVKDIKETLSDVGEAIETINSTMMKQTPEAFEMLFEQSGYKDIVDNVNELLDDNVEDVNTIKQYIRFEGGIITLGASDSTSKLIIQKDRISFMTGDNESAYISQNQLYITDSTILRKLQVGHWVTLEDEYGNLNTRWVGEE